MMMRKKVMISVLAMGLALLVMTLLAGDFLTGTLILAAAAVVPVLTKPLKELREERADKEKKLDELITKAEEEKRDLNEEEGKTYLELTKEIRELDAKIKATEDFEADKERRARRAIAKTEQQNEKKNIRSFSFLKLIRSQIQSLRQPLEGIELEMAQEAEREAKAAGLEFSGIGVPSIVLRTGKDKDLEERDLTAGTATGGAELVATEKGSFIEYLFAKLVLKAMGAVEMTGLQGNINFPTAASAISASWKAETTAASESSPTFGDTDFTPHKLTAFAEVSRQLLVQSSMDVENYVKGLLQMAKALAVDAAGINGTGASNQPYGILNTSGIGAPATGDNGIEISRNLVVNLIKEIKIDDADKGSLGFVTNPYVEAAMLGKKLDTGSGRFLLENAGDPLIGYKYMTTTQVPSNLTKGTGTNLSALIFGNFADMAIGQWGPIDMIVNPFSKDTEGLVRIIMNSWWDILIRHAQSFSALKDIIT